jgi:hypothetical protein
MSRPSHRTLVGALVLLLLAVAIRVPVLIERDTAALLERHGSDDLFYYAGMAHHLVRDGRPSIDGLHPTSGVQPAFLVLLAPVARVLGSDPGGMLRAILTLATMLILVAGCLTWCLVRRVDPASEATAWVAAAIVVLHPRIHGMTFEGTEGSLALVAWLVTLLTWHRAPEGLRGALLLGCLVGIGMLVRLDHVVLGALVLLRTASGRWRPTHHLTAAAATVALIMAPWVLACWAWTDTPSPDSGAAKALHALWMVADAGGGFPGHAAVAGSAIRQAVASLFGAGGGPSRVMLLVLTVLTVVVLAGRTRTDAWPTLRAVVSGLWPLFAGSILVVGTTATLLAGIRSWYLAPAYLGLAIGLGAALQDLASRSRRPGVAATVLLAVLIGSLWAEAIARPRRPWNAALLRAARRLAVHAEPGDRAGAFNAGILAAFCSPGITVSNLDGVANHDALVALRERSLAAFVDDQGITWLVDHEGSVRWYLGHAAPDLLPRLKRVDTIVPADRPDAAIGVWRILPQIPSERSATLGR